MSIEGFQQKIAFSHHLREDRHQAGSLIERKSRMPGTGKSGQELEKKHQPTCVPKLDT